MVVMVDASILFSNINDMQDQTPKLLIDHFYVQCFLGSELKGMVLL